MAGTVPAAPSPYSEQLNCSTHSTPAEKAARPRGVEELAHPHSETGKDTGVLAAVTTNPNKQRQGLYLYGRFIQMASDLRRWRVHTLTDHLVFSFPAKVFTTGSKQGVVKGFEIQGKFIGLKNNFSILVLGSGL